MADQFGQFDPIQNPVAQPLQSYAPLRPVAVPQVQPDEFGYGDGDGEDTGDGGSMDASESSGSSESSDSESSGVLDKATSFTEEDNDEVFGLKESDITGEPDKGDGDGEGGDADYSDITDLTEADNDEIFGLKESDVTGVDSRKQKQAQRKRAGAGQNQGRFRRTPPPSLGGMY